MSGDIVTIFDTTLRDGEQSPGCSMNTAEKLEVAKALVELGVDVIEADSPSPHRETSIRSADRRAIWRSGDNLCLAWLSSRRYRLSLGSDSECSENEFTSSLRPVRFTGNTNSK
ncbi:MAG: hypothetical protein R3C11_00555 [Planctomycetaceae bacterium]